LDFQKIGQPSVIGEIIAGIVLGPSLLGLYFPGFQEFISCGILVNFESDWVNPFLCLYRMELDLKVLKIKLMKP
jgi:Kef-type K+ transport system membrane component KefB